MWLLNQTLSYIKYFLQIGVSSINHLTYIDAEDDREIAFIVSTSIGEIELQTVVVDDITINIYENGKPLHKVKNYIIVPKQVNYTNETIIYTIEDTFSNRRCVYTVEPGCWISLDKLIRAHEDGDVFDGVEVEEYPIEDLPLD